MRKGNNVGRTMEKPVPPRFEEFGLTEIEYRRVPRLLRHLFCEKTYTRLGLIIAAVISLATFVGLLRKMESTLHGWYFGLPVGFVVFLMAAFLATVFIKFLVRSLSAFQGRLLGAVSESARRAVLYDDAMENYRKAMIKYESQYR